MIAIFGLCFGWRNDGLAMDQPMERDPQDTIGLPPGRMQALTPFHTEILKGETFSWFDGILEKSHSLRVA